MNGITLRTGAWDVAQRGTQSCQSCPIAVQGPCPSASGTPSHDSATVGMQMLRIRADASDPLRVVVTLHVPVRSRSE